MIRPDGPLIPREEPDDRVPTIRETTLDDAKLVITQDRNADYGTPEENFQTIASLWSTYIGRPVEPHDVAVMLLLVKVARIRTSPRKQDNWIDIAGYAACGAEVKPLI